MGDTVCKGVGRSEWVFGKQVGFAHSLARDPQVDVEVDVALVLLLPIDVLLSCVAADVALVVALVVAAVDVLLSGAAAGVALVVALVAAAVDVLLAGLLLMYALLHGCCCCGAERWWQGTDSQGHAQEREARKRKPLQPLRQRSPQRRRSQRTISSNLQKTELPPPDKKQQQSGHPGLLNINDCQGMIAATHMVGIQQAGGLPEG